MNATVERSLDVSGISLYPTLHPMAMFPSDPTTHLRPNQFARATLTPDGPATLLVNWSDERASAELWGEGSGWLEHRLEAILGLTDDVSGFERDLSSWTSAPGDHFESEAEVRRAELIGRLWHQRSGHRLCASHTLWHDVVWLIPGQRVTSRNAAEQWRSMVRAYSEPAPGPLELMLPPAPQVVAAAPYTDFHRFGIERKRADAIRAAAKLVPRFAESTDLPSAELRTKLELTRGVGVWTSTNVSAMTQGDPDTPVLGDYGLPATATWNLAGERVGTDERMMELLAPFRPHRWRVMRLLMAGGQMPPRRGPRKRNPRIQQL